MGADSQLSGYSIPNPCAMNWDEMNGDARERFCAACGKHVRDLTVLSAAKCADVLEHADNGICARLYAGPDGTLTTSAADVAIAPRVRPLQFTIRSIMGVVAGVAATLGIGRPLADRAVRPAPRPPVPVSRTTMGVLVAPRSIRQLQPANSPANSNKLSPAQCAEAGDLPLEL